MLGSFESARWNACVHIIDLRLYSHPKEFSGNGVRTHVNSKGKILSTGSSEVDRTHDAASGRTASPTHCRLSYSGPTGSLAATLPGPTGSLAATLPGPTGSLAATLPGPTGSLAATLPGQLRYSGGHSVRCLAL